MANRKVFFSFLGTGFYYPGRYGCEYEIVDGTDKKKPTKVKKTFESQYTRFIQRATLEWIGAKEWSGTDIVAIAVTKEAKTSNWIVPDNKRDNRNTKESEDYVGLEDELYSLDLPMVPIVVDVPNGKDKNEMWDVFNKVYSILEPGDELYIDITHSFRYLPMLVFALIDYSRFLKGVNIKMVSYGNWEAKDPMTGIMPLVDLTPIVTLQNWTTAAAELIHNGAPKAVKAVSDDALSDFLRDPLLRTTNITNLNNATRKLDDWVSAITTCRGIEIISAKDYLQFKDLLQQLTTHDITPLTAILRNLEESFNNVPFPFEKGSIHNMYSAAKWCADKKMWQPAITLLEESFISEVANLAGLRITVEGDRELASSALSIFSQKKEEKDWRVKKEEHRIIIREILSLDFFKNDFLQKVYSRITELRNSVNHAGICGSIADAKRIERAISTTINESLQFFDDNTPDLKEFKTTILINLSNHPSVQWSEEQLNAAKDFGDIEDWDFPSIDCEADNKFILQLADEYLARIFERIKTSNITVHIMGEMTFTYALVTKLKNLDIPCIASTTERKVTENADGTKTSSFHFVRFRQY